MTIIAAVLFAGAAFCLVAVVLVVRSKAKDLRAREERLAQQSRVAEKLLAIARRFVLASRESLGSLRLGIDEEVRRHFKSVEAIAIYDTIGADELRCVYASGDRLADYVGSSLPMASQKLPAVAARECEMVTLGSRPDAQPLTNGDRDALAVPLVVEPGATSVVYVAGSTPPRGGWKPVEAVLAQAAPSYWIAAERDDMMRRLTYDPMTALYNRSAFELRLREALRRGDDVAVAYIDLDGFKAWNDTYGHKSGDNVLAQVGDLMLQHLLTRHDLAGRLGGDEMAIAYIGSPKSRAIDFALRLGAAIYHADRSEILTGEDRGLAIKASIGVAHVSELALVQHLDDETLRQMRTDRRQLDEATDEQRLLILADALMYAAKTNGKDRVAFYLENGERNMVTCSDYERRDPGSRPGADRRSEERMFASNGQRQFASVHSRSREAL